MEHTAVRDRAAKPKQQIMSQIYFDGFVTFEVDGFKSRWGLLRSVLFPYEREKRGKTQRNFVTFSFVLDQIQKSRRRSFAEKPKRCQQQQTIV
jgi:hypothetical protein